MEFSPGCTGHPGSFLYILYTWRTLWSLNWPPVGGRPLPRSFPPSRLLFFLPQDFLCSSFTSPPTALWMRFHVPATIVKDSPSEITGHQPRNPVIKRFSFLTRERAAWKWLGLRKGSRGTAGDFRLVEGTWDPLKGFGQLWSPKYVVQ